MSERPILRDKKGRLIKGTGPLPGAGRPIRKRDKLDKLIEQFYGKDCEQILINMIEVAQYDADYEFEHNTPNSKKRYFKPKYTNQQVVDARKFLFEHYYGKALNEVKAEIDTKVTKVKVDLPENLDPEDL